MKTINIVLFFPNTYPHPQYSEERGKARHDDLISYFPEDVQFYLIKDETKYVGNDTFVPDYIRSGDIWIRYTGGEIYAELILGPNKGSSFKNIYHNPIKEFCRDKRKIEKIFPDITLASHTCDNYGEILSNWDKIKSNTKVLKPIFGSQGRGIIIGNTIPSEQEIEEEYPYILQEFLDTTGGFYGHDGVHDFRTIILDGKITGSLLRVAQDGIMTANVNTGAAIIDYNIGNIPPEVEKVIWQVDAYLEKLYPSRYYSIDIGLGKEGEIKVFELNASPMLSTPSIIKGLATHIIKNILKIS